jgi:hypothetical protein
MTTGNFCSFSGKNLNHLYFLARVFAGQRPSEGYCVGDALIRVTRGKYEAATCSISYNDFVDEVFNSPALVSNNGDEYAAVMDKLFHE